LTHADLVRAKKAKGYAIAVAVAAVVVVIGGLAPWMKIGTATRVFTKSGLDQGGDVLVTVALAIISLTVAVGVIVGWEGGAIGRAAPEASAMIPEASAMIIFAIGFNDILSISKRVEEANRAASGFIRVEVGAGLYLTILGGILMGIAAIFLAETRRSEVT
jgi:hypothetical protein